MISTKKLMYKIVEHLADSKWVALAAHPVGSYYETSDGDFDPNVEWGGTWSLEEGGRVHIGAGTSYPLGSTGGSKDAIVVNHTHGTGSATAPYFLTTTSTGSAGTMEEQSGRTRHYFYQNTTSSGTYWGHPQNTGNASGGTDGTDKNMMPYLSVNRWHRTA